MSFLVGVGYHRPMVSGRWRYATIGLGVLVVAQFLWWNAKAPSVLKLGGGY